jgi:hypothetical protein
MPHSSVFARLTSGAFYETIALLKFARPSRAEKRKEVSIENLSGKSRMKVLKPNLK